MVLPESSRSGQIQNDCLTTSPSGCSRAGSGNILRLPFWAGDPGTADTTTWSYHEGSGLLTSKQDAADKSVSYTYTTGGRLATRTWSRTVAGVGDPGPLVATYSYSTAGDLTAIDYSDTTPDVTFTCDRLGRQKTASSSISSHEFAYVLSAE